MQIYGVNILESGRLRFRGVKGLSSRPSGFIMEEFGLEFQSFNRPVLYFCTQGGRDLIFSPKLLSD